MFSHLIGASGKKRVPYQPQSVGGRYHPRGRDDKTPTDCAFPLFFLLFQGLSPDLDCKNHQVDPL